MRSKNKIVISLILLLSVGIFFVVLTVKNYAERKIIVEKIEDIYLQIRNTSDEKGGLYEDIKDKIEPLCLRIIELNKDKVYDYTILGYVYYALDNNEKAVSLLTKAIELNSMNGRAHAFLARVYKAKENYEAALNENDAAYKVHDAEILPYVLTTYGLISNNKKNFEKACEYFKKALDLNSRMAALYEILGSIYLDKIKDFGKTIEICKKGLSIYPNRWYLLMMMGNAYIELREPNKAIAALEEVEELLVSAESKKLSNENKLLIRSGIITSLGYSYFLLSDFDKAKIYFSEAEKLTPSSEKLSLYMGILNNVQGKNEKEISEYMTSSPIPTKIFLKNGFVIEGISIREDKDGYWLLSEKGETYYNKTEVDRIVKNSTEESELYELKKAIIGSSQKQLDGFLKEYDINIENIKYKGKVYTLTAEQGTELKKQEDTYLLDSLYLVYAQITTRRIDYCFKNREKMDRETIMLILNGKIKLDMTKGQVNASWGKPKEINESIGGWGAHEQWVYDSQYLYFENGKLTSWQSRK